MKGIALVNDRHRPLDGTARIFALIAAIGFRVSPFSKRGNRRADPPEVVAFYKERARQNRLRKSNRGPGFAQVKGARS